LRIDFGELRIDGTADALISSLPKTAEIGLLTSCHVIFELKKPSNLQKKLNQTQLELLAADLKSNFDVISVYTDLNEDLNILRIAKTITKSNEKKSAIFYTKVERGLAIGFLRYHLRSVTKKVKKNRKRIIDFLRSEDYDDADDQKDQQRKRDKIISKSRPTFFSSSILETNATDNDRQTNDRKHDQKLLLSK
jgi:hypothetical protein